LLFGNGGDGCNVVFFLSNLIDVAPFDNLYTCLRLMCSRFGTNCNVLLISCWLLNLND
jgi:hypothetical protein